MPEKRPTTQPPMYKEMVPVINHHNPAAMLIPSRVVPSPALVTSPVVAPSAMPSTEKSNWRLMAVTAPAITAPQLVRFSMALTYVVSSRTVWSLAGP